MVSGNSLCAKSLQLYPTLWDLMDCSIPGSPVHGILQARILGWIATPSSRGSSCSRDQTRVSHVYLLWQGGSILLDFPCGSDSKDFACNAEDWGLIPGSGRSPGEGNGNPPQYSRLENPMDRGAWWTIVHGVTKSWTRLSDNILTTYLYWHQTKLSWRLELA